MMAETMIDFIVPMHNAEHTVGRTLRSIVAQSELRWNAIVIDDGSVDGSADAVRTMDDPRIRVCRQPNAGVSAARNRGFALSNAPFVCFLDADDTIEPDYAQRLLPKAQAAPFGAACACDYLAPDGRQILPAWMPSDQSFTMNAFCALDCPPIMSLLHKRSAIAAVSINAHPFDPTLDAFEDLDLLIRLRMHQASGAKPWAHESATLAHYWKTPCSLSSINPRVHACGLEILRRYTDGNTRAYRDWTLRCLAASVASDDRQDARERLAELSPLSETETERLDPLLRWQICRRHAVNESMLACRADAVLESINDVLAHESCVPVLRALIGSWGADRWMQAVRVVDGARSSRGRLIIYGLGRNGQQVAYACTGLGLAFAAIDDDPARIPEGVRSLRIDELTGDDVVLVTPDNSSPILEKIREITPARVWTIASALRHTDDAPSPTATV